MNDDMIKIQNYIKKLETQIIDEKNKLKPLMIEALLNKMRDFFKEFPKIKQIGYFQYTPYWCDGDICTFCAQTEDLEEYFDVCNLDFDYDDDYSEKLQIAWNNIMEKFKNDDLLLMFGDHKAIHFKNEDGLVHLEISNYEYHA